MTPPHATATDRTAADPATGAGAQRGLPADGWRGRLSAWERWLNPIVFKDLLTFARNPSGGVSRLLLYALVFAVPLLGFAWLVAFVPGSWRFAGRPVFLGVCALLAFFHLAVAVPAATAFALERDRNTLESLVVSPLNPWRLVLGKFATAIAVGALGKAAVSPALAVAWVLGGGDIGFLPRYLLLLLAVDASLAAFALNVGARRRDAPSKIGWIKAQTTQTQMALQATVGLSVATSLIPIYAAIFLVPLALQHGVRVAATLDLLAPLGALHPLAALILWGDADVLGLRCPVWVLGAVFHVLVALPLLADCAEAQRSEGARPGRLPRLLALPALGMLLLLGASVAARLGPLGQTLIATLLPAVVVLWGASRVGFGGELPARITPRGVALGLLPHRALESSAERAPGYALLLALTCAPLLLWAGQWGGGGVSALGALALVGVALAALGARLTARLQAREDRAFLEALRSGRAQSAEEAPDPAAEEEAARTPSRRPLFYLALAALVLPGAAGTALALEASFPALQALRPALVATLTAGLALNPLASLLPILADPRLLGSDGLLRWLESAHLAPWAVFATHLVLYGGALLAAIGTLRRPLDVEEALATTHGEAAASASLEDAAPEPAPLGHGAGEPEPLADGPGPEELVGGAGGEPAGADGEGAAPADGDGGPGSELPRG